MWRTFNCGIGFVLVVPQGDVAAVEAELQRLALAHRRIGEVVPAADGERVHIG
jgi:phosphoribosylformylglycinamidine cyclo-ligase